MHQPSLNEWVFYLKFALTKRKRDSFIKRLTLICEGLYASMKMGFNEFSARLLDTGPD